MSDTIEPLLVDMLEWIAKEERPYAEVMEAWRTSCPRLPVWEEACDRGLVARRSVPGRGTLVVATTSGRKFLQQHGRPSVAAVPERGAA